MKSTKKMIRILALLFCLLFQLTAAGQAGMSFAAEEDHAVLSTDLERFLIGVTCSAPVDEHGNYTINPEESYQLSLSFRENETLQFHNEEDLIYVLPAGLLVPDFGPTAFDIEIEDKDGVASISNNTYRVSDGKLIVHINQNDPNFERFKAVANAAFGVALSIQVQEGAGTIVFNSDIQKDFVFEAPCDLTIAKQVSYDSQSDQASYTLTITSTGQHESVSVQDILSGTALNLNRDVAVTSSVSGVLSPGIDYNSVANGFVFEIPQMTDGEVLTVQYTAAVDNSKISSNGTVEQTGNTARVTSTQIPEGKEAEADFAGKVKFHRINKKAQGDTVQIGDHLYEQTWRIEVNNDHKLDMGGTPVYDWITGGSRPFMLFSGDGIIVQVTMEDGTTDSRDISWEQLSLYTNAQGTYGWGYTPPESDGKASYVIYCKTLIDSSKVLNGIALSNGAQVNQSYVEAIVNIEGTGNSVFDFEKHQLGTTSKESSWELVYTADGEGYDEARIVDDLPKLTYKGVDYIDAFLPDSIEVKGLLPGESYGVALNESGRTFVITFYQDDAQTKKGLKSTPDGEPRDIVIRFKTEVNQQWLAISEEEGKYEQHSNKATGYANGNPNRSGDSVVPKRQAFSKEALKTDKTEIGGVVYPVYQYVLTLKGVIQDDEQITDTFDTEYLRYYPDDGIVIAGVMDDETEDQNGTVSVQETNAGMKMTVSAFPKQKDGSFYPVYKIYYTLIVKDENALHELNKKALESGTYTLANTASWNELTTDEVHVVHSYYPYVDKELTSLASADNGHIAEFKLIINQDASDLDPNADVLQVQDQLSSNLRLIQDSIEINPADENIRVQFDRESNTITFVDVPDSKRVEVIYKARVLGQGNVSYSNTVRFGKYEKTVESNVQIESSGSGSGSNPSITLVKRDAEDMETKLGGASFELYFLRDGIRYPVRDKDGNTVVFTTGEDGTALIVGNQAEQGWTLWEERTYQLVEIVAPAGYQLAEEPTEFVLSRLPASQIEYSLTGDSVTVWNTPDELQEEPPVPPAEEPPETPQEETEQRPKPTQPEETKKQALDPKKSLIRTNRYAPQTGDQNKLELYWAAALLAMAVIMVLLYRKKKH